MKNENDIHREVEKTMHSLDGIEPAATDDFFYSRLQTRMESREEPGYSLALGIAAGIIIVLMNVLTVLHLADSSHSADTISQEELTAFAETYELTTPVIYEQNSDE